MFMDHLLPTTPSTTYVILALMYCIEEATSRIMELILSNLVVSRGSESALVNTLRTIATLLELRAKRYDLCKNTTLS